MNFLMQNVEMPLIPVVAELEANGYLIDCHHFTVLKTRLEPEQSLVLADIQAIAGAEFNPNSSKQVAKLLHRDLGLPILLRDERWSTQAVERDMIAADMSRAKRAEKIDSGAAAFILQGAIDALTIG